MVFDFSRMLDHNKTLSRWFGKPWPPGFFYPECKCCGSDPCPKLEKDLDEKYRVVQGCDFAPRMASNWWVYGLVGQTCCGGVFGTGSVNLAHTGGCIWKGPSRNQGSAGLNCPQDDDAYLQLEISNSSPEAVVTIVTTATYEGQPIVIRYEKARGFDHLNNNTLRLVEETPNCGFNVYNLTDAEKYLCIRPRSEIPFACDSFLCEAMPSSWSFTLSGWTESPNHPSGPWWGLPCSHYNATYTMTYDPQGCVWKTPGHYNPGPDITGPEALLLLDTTSSLVPDGYVRWNLTIVEGTFGFKSLRSLYGNTDVAIGSGEMYSLDCFAPITFGIKAAGPHFMGNSYATCETVPGEPEAETIVTVTAVA